MFSNVNFLGGPLSGPLALNSSYKIPTPGFMSQDKINEIRISNRTILGAFNFKNLQKNKDDPIYYDIDLLMVAPDSWNATRKLNTLLKFRKIEAKSLNDTSTCCSVHISS